MPLSRPLSVILAFRLCCGTSQLSRPQEIKPPLGLLQARSRAINPLPVNERKTSEREMKEALLPAWQRSGAERGGWLPWGNTATSRERRAGSGTAGRDRTGPTELISLRGCSSFPNQASTEPWRAQRELLRGRWEWSRGTLPSFRGSPSISNFPPVWSVRSPFERCVPRGVGAAAVGHRCRGRGTEVVSWHHLRTSGTGWLCGAWAQRWQCQL